MSLQRAIASKGNNKFVLPCAGKMFRSSISKSDKALCFVLNKGYFETDDLISMLSILEDVLEFKEIVLVGKVEKVRLAKDKSIVYRQRVFFKSLRVLLNLCKLLGVRFEVAQGFHISINNIMNCVDDLVYLERYAKRFDESIDVWLTNCCLIELYYLMKSLNVYSDLGSRVNEILNNRINYLYRAPFLISSYSIDSKSSGIFLGFKANDKRLYEDNVTGEELLSYGYTQRNIEKDIKGGALK